MHDENFLFLRRKNKKGVGLGLGGYNKNGVYCETIHTINNMVCVVKQHIPLNKLIYKEKI